MTDKVSADVLNGEAQTRLRTIVERIERLNQDADDIAGDLKEVYAEAKYDGYDVKAIRKIVAMRKMDRAKRLELEALIDLYLSAIGGL